MQQSFLKCVEEIIRVANFEAKMSILHIDVFLLKARKPMSFDRFQMGGNYEVDQNVPKWL